MIKTLTFLAVFTCGCMLDDPAVPDVGNPSLPACELTAEPHGTRTITRISEGGKDVSASTDGRFAVGALCSGCSGATALSLIQGPDISGACLADFVYLHTWATYGECVNVGTPYAECPRIDHTADVYFRSTWKATP